MGQLRRRAPVRGIFTATLILLIAFACANAARAQQGPPPLSVADESLPSLNTGIDVHVPLHASGGVPPYHWSVATGDLPPGVSLDPAGFLDGRPSKIGDFAFTATVSDSAVPAHSINKEFHAEVTAALLLEWLQPPQIRGTAIEGAVQVSNGTKDDFDLTVIIVAVNEVGRATALGYQEITLKPGTTNFQVPFGSTLPAGEYVVHADAVAEIAAKNTIVRERLQTPAALRITQVP